MKKTFIALLLSAILAAPTFALDYNSSETIKQVQEALNAAGYDCGTPDGIAGSATSGQIEKYRADKGLKAGTVIDEELYNSLFPATKDDDADVTDALEQAPDTRSKEEIKEELKKNYHLSWFGNVRNDVTGNWRLSEYSSSTVFENFALDYYKAFVESDKEVHAVINMVNKVTYRLNIFDDYLLVTALEYVDKEEHDAKKLFSGMELGEFYVYKDTGKIEDLDELYADEESYADSYDGTDAFDLFTSYYEPILQDCYGKNYKIEEDGNLLLISVWADGVAEGTSLASLGNMDALSNYAQLKETTQNSTQILTRNLKLLDPDAHLLFTILNDLDLNSVLLSYYDGTLYYDVLGY